MAEPFSILAGAAGLADVAVRTSSKLRHLISEFKHAPDLILALSNEVTDIGVVLTRVAGSRQAVANLGGTEQDNLDFLGSLDSPLKKARSLLNDLDALDYRLSSRKTSTKRFRWLEESKNANRLKGSLRTVREKINDMLIAHAVILESQIKLELQEVRVGMHEAQTSGHEAAQRAHSNYQTTNDELVSLRTSIVQQQRSACSGLQAVQDTVQSVQETMSRQLTESANRSVQVSDRLSSINSAISYGAHNLSRLEARQDHLFSAIMNQMAALSARRISGDISSDQPQQNPVLDHQSTKSSSIFFSMRFRESCCADSCQCRCHQPARMDMSLQMPRMLRAVLGNMFLGYAGYPSGGCNIDSCVKMKYIRLQVTYGFPLWFLAFRFHAMLKASFCGTLTFALATKRIVSAEDPSGVIYHLFYGTLNSLDRLLKTDSRKVRQVCMDDGRPGLALALRIIVNDRLAKIRLLLRHGADLDQFDDFGLSPRLWAARCILTRGPSSKSRGELAVLFPDTTYSDAVGLSLLHKIVLGIVPIKLKHALLNPDIRQLLNVKDELGMTPLMYAANLVDLTAVHTLIEAGASVNSTDKTNYTALHHVVHVKSQDPGILGCIDELLLAGAKPHIVSDQGPCLHLAAKHNNVSAAAGLIDSGSTDLEALRPQDGTSPLWLAARFNCVDMVRFLLSAGASTEATDFQRRTPLFPAVEYGWPEVITLLLDSKAHTLHVCQSGWTILHEAAYRGADESCLDHQWRLRRLKSAGIGIRGLDASARDKTGLTARELLDMYSPATDFSQRAAFVALEELWCRPAKELTHDGTDDEDEFYDAVEVM